MRGDYRMQKMMNCVGLKYFQGHHLTRSESLVQVNLHNIHLHSVCIFKCDFACLFVYLKMH